MDKDSKTIKIYTIGELDFSSSLTEDVISKKGLKKLGLCTIEVYPSERDIPHFHLTNKDNSFDTCIKIYSSEYFPHENHRDLLNNRQCKELNNWLKEKNKITNIPLMTNWQTIVFAWEFANGKKSKFPESKKANIQPDYSKLNL